MGPHGRAAPAPRCHRAPPRSGADSAAPWPHISPVLVGQRWGLLALAAPILPCQHRPWCGQQHRQEPVQLHPGPRPRGHPWVLSPPPWVWGSAGDRDLWQGGGWPAAAMSGSFLPRTLHPACAPLPCRPPHRGQNRPGPPTPDRQHRRSHPAPSCSHPAPSHSISKHPGTEGQRPAPLQSLGSEPEVPARTGCHRQGLLK